MSSSGRQTSRVALIVDSDALVTSKFRFIAESSGYVGAEYTRFETARSRLLKVQPPAVLIANARLGAFNGVHLAYLVKLADASARVLIYADPHDPVLAREARRAGAFYQPRALLFFSLGGWLGATLPAADRRQVAGADRRATARGGRRVTDGRTTGRRQSV